MKVSLKYEGIVFSNFEAEDAIAVGVPDSVVQEALLQQAWSLVRTKRDRLIAETDYAIMPDYPINDDQRADVTAYRQALRDIPETFESPDKVEWPEKPEALTQ